MNKKIRQQVYNKYNGHCAYCGIEISIKDMQVDHFHSKVTGGTDVFDNLMPSCRQCNRLKLHWSIESFRAEILRQVQYLNRYSVKYRNAKRFGLLMENQLNVEFYFEKAEESKI